MTLRRPFFAACCIAATALCLPIAACSSGESRAREHYAEYQAAAAAGDLVEARKALRETVAAKDDSPDYWKELGKLEVELGLLNDAYDAFKHAHELDRSNSEILANLTQLALMSNQIGLAEEHARELELIAGESPAVNLAYGYAALQRQDVDKADQHADRLIEALPYEPSAKLLKARILVTRHKNGEAIALLENQLKARPDDELTLKALMALHERSEDWKKVAETASRAANLDPKDKATRLMAVDAALRQKDISAAMRAARPFLNPQASGESVDSVLLLWAERWRSPQAVETARKFSASAGPQQRLAYASYFNEVGKPGYTAEIVGTEPILPITITNSATNAVIADAMAQSGRAEEAMRLFNAILEKEPDHVYALRARINLEIRTGKALAAVSDAQRLVSVMPKSARDRVLLARAYHAAKDRRQLDRTLWDAFHEIPGNRDLYEALRANVAKYGDPDAVRRVDDEYANQKDVELAREFI